MDLGDINIKSIAFNSDSFLDPASLPGSSGLLRERQRSFPHAPEAHCWSLFHLDYLPGLSAIIAVISTLWGMGSTCPPQHSGSCPPCPPSDGRTCLLYHFSGHFSDLDLANHSAAYLNLNDFFLNQISHLELIPLFQFVLSWLILNLSRYI